MTTSPGFRFTLVRMLLLIALLGVLLLVGIPFWAGRHGADTDGTGPERSTVGGDVE